MFTLNEALQNDTVLIGHYPLSLVLLHKDANYPWCILVPQRSSITEIYQLDSADQKQLLDESCQLSETMVGLYAPNKMNIAALGNMVPQLHIHLIARQTGDAAWPGPVWGVKPAQAYSEEALTAELKRLQAALFN